MQIDKPGKKPKKNRRQKWSKAMRQYWENTADHKGDHWCESCPPGKTWIGNTEPVGGWVHHIVHKSQGGKDVPENMRLECISCHNESHGIKTK